MLPQLHLHKVSEICVIIEIYLCTYKERIFYFATEAQAFKIYPLLTKWEILKDIIGLHLVLVCSSPGRHLVGYWCAIVWAEASTSGVLSIAILPVVVSLSPSAPYHDNTTTIIAAHVDVGSSYILLLHIIKVTTPSGATEAVAHDAGSTGINLSHNDVQKDFS